MERITAEELRAFADSYVDGRPFTSDSVKLAAEFYRAADTLEEMDKDIAVLEHDRERMQQILREEVDE